MNTLARARAIVTAPRPTWPLVAAEPESGQRLFSGYVVPLSAIGPVCTLISLAAFHGLVVLGTVEAIGEFAASLLFVWATGLATAAIAPRFGGSTDRVQSLKLIAYASTAGWLAGIFELLPFGALGKLVVLVGRLYGLYLLRLGIGPVLGVRDDRATEAFLVIVLVSIAIAIAIAVVVGALLFPFVLASSMRGLSFG